MLIIFFSLRYAIFSKFFYCLISQVFKSRIEESTKRKSTISGLTKAVNAEKTLIISEITIEVTRLTERLEQLTAKSSYLFPDAIKLIASEEDLAPIIKQRIDDEQKRELEIKAKAQEEIGRASCRERV